jgi:sulfonate transport system ATP-binding protein
VSESLQPPTPPALSVDIQRMAYPGMSTPVLEDIRFEVINESFVTVLGPSGCGKTTLLRILVGLETEYDGLIAVDGKTISNVGTDRAIVFQESRLLPWYTVKRNVEFGLPDKAPKGERGHRVADALKLVGLTEYADHIPKQLSGGLRKLAAIARAIVAQPRFLFWDEPFSSLDPKMRYRVHDEVLRIHRARKLTSILVTHDVDEAIYLSDTVIVLSPKPTHVRATTPICLAVPRDRTSAEFALLRAGLLRQYDGERER